MKASSGDSPLSIDLSQTSTFKQLHLQPPLLSSLEAGWTGIQLGFFEQPPNTMPEIVTPRHSIIVFTDAPKPILAERYLDGRFRRDRVIPGDILVIPAHVSHQASWDTQGSYIALVLEPSTFAGAVCEWVDPDRFELVPHFATPDPLVYQLGVTLKAELETDGLTSQLYAETVTHLLAVHLLQHYSAQKPTIKKHTGGLSKNQYRQVIEYINAHLDRPLSLAHLASLIGINPYYFSRLFKQSIGITPHQYIIYCRIERAKLLLRRRTLTIAQIAYNVGFANQGHLTYHFKRLVGVTPKKFLS